MSERIPPISRGERVRAAAGEGRRTPRFGFALLVQRLRAYRREAEERRDPGAMDRRRVLRRLGEELGAPPELLLERGFDKAYRRVVEGV